MAPVRAIDCASVAVRWMVCLLLLIWEAQGRDLSPILCRWRLPTSISRLACVALRSGRLQAVNVALVGHIGGTGYSGRERDGNWARQVAAAFCAGKRRDGFVHRGEQEGITSYPIFFGKFDAPL